MTDTTQTPAELRKILADSFDEYATCGGHGRAARAKETATAIARRLRDAGEELGLTDWRLREVEAWLDGRSSRFAD